MEIKQVLLKTRAEFGKQCIFDTYGPHMDVEIKPDPGAMANYITRTQCNLGVQHTKQFALHEAQTIGTRTKSSGMFHFEGGWPKEINPKDEEATTRLRRRIEKDDNWAPKLRNLFQEMEHGILQNGAQNIYENYFDDMTPTVLVKPRSIRTINVYQDPQTPARPVNNISWSPDSGSKMVVSYCFFGVGPDYSNVAYIWQIDNPNKPWMTLGASSAALASEFNPRDPSVLVSGLMSGRVCCWDVRTGSAPVQMSHRQFSHRDFATAVKWIATKSNTEFFSGSSDGRAMWWDTRKLREPTEVLVFDLDAPDQPDMDRAIGVTSADYEPSVGIKFMFGLDNGIVISGSRKMRTPAEKLAMRFKAHYGPVLSVDRSAFNPKIFLTVGDYTARVWAEDAKESLVSTRFIMEEPTQACWNKTRHSMFYVTTRTGVLNVWDLLANMENPILTMKLCEQELTAIAPHETGSLLAVGNSTGNVYLVESTEALYSFDKNEKSDLTSYLETCSHFLKAVDARLKEIKLAKTMTAEEVTESVDTRDRKKDKRPLDDRIKRKPKDYREKTKIAIKKNPREEFPELQEVEDRFFEMVKQEKQKYEDIDILNDLSSPKLTRSRGKFGRKTDKDSRVILTEIKEIETKISPKKISEEDRDIEEYPKKAEIIATKQIAQDTEQEKATAEMSLLSLAEAILKSPVHEISKRKRRTKARKRPMFAVFKLSRPCKVGICKPAVCCRKTEFQESKIRSADRIVKDREKWSEVDERRPKDVDDDGGSRTSSASKDKMRRKRRESWTKLLRAYKRHREGAKIRFQQEVTVPGELAVIVGDERRAKMEVKEVGGTKMKTRKLAGKARKSSVTGKSRDTPRRSRKDIPGDLDKEVTSTTRRIVAARMGRKARRAIGAVDPCALWKPPSLAKDLRTLLGGPVLESIEREPSISGTARLEEIETAHGRVYPRISDFHPIE